MITMKTPNKKSGHLTEVSSVLISVLLAVALLSNFSLSGQIEKEIITDQPQNRQDHYPIVAVPQSENNFAYKTTSNCWSNLDASYINGINDLTGADSYAINNPKDDGSYGPIALGWSFNYYGQEYNEIYINVNGNITFGSMYSAYSASGFPSSSVPAMIAPFWADVDLRGAGTGANQIYVKVDEHKVIVQWIEVGYYNSNSDKSNTFQVILSDGTDPEIGVGYNARFGYKNMDWCVGDASGGTDGFGNNVYGTVGAQSPGGANFYQIGLFGQDNYAYDGAGGSLDGVHYLDGRCFTMDLTSSNVPPIAIDFPNTKEVGLCPGMIYSLSSSFSAPEVNQDVITEITNTTLSSFSTSSTTGNLSRQAINIGVDASDIGQHYVYYHSYDNGTPVAHTYDTLTINVYDCDAIGAGTSLAMDGIDDYVQVSHHSALYSGGTGTYTMWVYPEESSPSSDVFIVSKAGQYAMGFKGITNAPFFKGKIGDSWYELTAPAATVLNKWMHVATVVTEAKMYLYINGVKKDSVGISGPINSVGTPLFIGTDNNKQSFFKGRLDEIAVISTAVSEEGFLALPWEVGGVESKYIRAYFKCEDGVDLVNQMSSYNGALINVDTENCWKSNYAAVWNGRSNGQWSNPSNWETGLPPLAVSNGSLESADYVIFPPLLTGENPLVLEETVDVNTIVFSKGSLARIQSAGQLKVNDNLYAIESPTYDGEVLMNGGLEQVIYGQNDFKDLTIDGEVTLRDDQTIKGVLTLNSSVLHINGMNLTLLSDSLSTGQVFHNSGSINGKITIERYMPFNAGAIGWHYLSSPFITMDFVEINKTVPLTGLGNGPNDNPWPNIYTYDESKADADKKVGWWSPASLASQVAEMQGFILLHSAAGGTVITADGYVQSGDVSANLSYTPSTNSESDGWHLIGNPYPSMIDWDLVNKAVGMDDAFYVYDSEKDQYASYVNGISTNGGIDKIATMQSFFVHVNQTTTFNLNNDCRSVGNNSLHFRTTEDQGQKTIRIKVSADGHSDETVLVVNSRASSEFDSDFDAYKIIPSVPVLDIYTTIGDSKISINARPEFLEEEQIKLVVKGTEAKTHSIELVKEKGIDTEENTFLYDNQLDSIHDLVREGMYQFKYDEKNSDTRFHLQFTDHPIVTSVEAEKEHKSLIVFISSNELTIAGFEAGSSVTIFSLDGRTHKRLKTSRATFIEDISDLPSGCYIVTVRNDMQQKSVKVLIN